MERIFYKLPDVNYRLQIVVCWDKVNDIKNENAEKSRLWQFLIKQMLTENINMFRIPIECLPLKISLLKSFDIIYKHDIYKNYEV